MDIYDSTIQENGSHGAWGRKLRCRTERDINGVRYLVRCSFEGEADFRELYEKCLAARLLRLKRQGCAGTQPADGMKGGSVL